MKHFWMMVLLLGAAFFVRAHRVTTLPPFNDESLHIRRAEQVWTFDNPDLSFTVGKLLTYYWYGIFQADRLDAIFVTRTATALFSLLGLAAAGAVGKRLFGKDVGVLALSLLAFAPFMLFFDRMALTDPITTSLGMVTVWASLRFLNYPASVWAGIGVGILCTLTILAKLTGLPFAAIPILGVLIFARDSWRRYRISLVACYLTIGGLLTPFFVRVVYKELSGQRISVVDTHLINTKSPLETILDNLGHLWEASTVFSSLPFLVLGLIVVAISLWWRPRPFLFLLGCLALVWGFSVGVGGVMSDRYLQLGVPLLFLLVAGGLAVTLRQGAWIVTVGWIALFCAPFIYHAWNNPIENDYPARARWEYFMNFTAGYALMDAAEFMPTLPPNDSGGRVSVLGLVGSCHQIRLYLDEAGIVHLECLEFGWSGELMDAVANYVDQRVAEESTLYMLVEPQLPYTDLSKLRVQHEVIATWERPYNGMRVELWRVEPRQ